MVEQTLNAKNSAMQTIISVEEAKVADLSSSQDTLATKVSEAEVAFAAQKEVVQTSKLRLAEVTTTANASRAALTDLQALQKTSDAKLASARHDTVALESAFEHHFKPMREDAAGPHFKELEPFLRTLEMEESLLIALPSTCAKTKEHRGTFDNVCLDELEKALCSKMSSLGEIVTVETLASVERAAAVEAAQKEYDAKKAAQMEAVTEFEAVQKDLKDHEATLSKSRQAVEELQPQIDVVLASVAKAKDALDAFKAGPLAGFKSFSCVAVATVAAAPLGA
jgi:chromosome segregation ATPase